MYSVTESTSDADCVQGLLLIFTRPTATPDVCVCVGGGGGGAIKFSNQIFPPSKITLPLHGFIKEFYKKYSRPK